MGRELARVTRGWAGSWEWSPGLRSHMGAAQAAHPAASSPGDGEAHTRLPQTQPAAEGPLLRLHPPTRGLGEFTHLLSPLPDLQAGLVQRREETCPLSGPCPHG